MALLFVGRVRTAFHRVRVAGPPASVNRRLQAWMPGQNGEAVVERSVLALDRPAGPAPEIEHSLRLGLHPTHDLPRDHELDSQVAAELGGPGTSGEDEAPGPVLAALASDANTAAVRRPVEHALVAVQLGAMA